MVDEMLHQPSLNGNSFLPKSPDAERSVLGSLLRGDTSLDDELAWLGVDHFMDDSHRLIFQEMLALRTNNEPVDVLLLAERLHQRGLVDRVGGYAIFAELKESAPTPFRAYHHAMLLKELHRRRQLIFLAHEIDSRVRTGCPLPEIEELARQELLEQDDTQRTQAQLRPIPASKLDAESKPVDWFWYGILAAYTVTLFTSLWKAGKSTLLGILLAASRDGGELAGLSVSVGRVLVITEESGRSWRQRCVKLGIGDNVDFLCRPLLGNTTEAEWTRFITSIAALTTKNKYRLVAIDTIAAFWPVVHENDAGEVQRALRPIHAISEAGAAILLNHHPRKGDGSHGTASRGSGALPAFADILLEMRRDATADRRRVLTALSRFDETPSELVIELDESGTHYRGLGTTKDVARKLRFETLESILRTPTEEEGGRDVKQILKDWPEDVTKPSPRTVSYDLTEGVSKNLWTRTGTGKRGKPFRYLAG